MTWTPTILRGPLPAEYSLCLFRVLQEHAQFGKTQRGHKEFEVRCQKRPDGSITE